MSRIEQIYNQIKSHMQQYVGSLLSKVVESTNTEFVNLNLIQHITKVFTSLLTYLATSYELVKYFTGYKLTDLIKA